jgi:hypothetical protein
MAHDLHNHWSTIEQDALDVLGTLSGFPDDPVPGRPRFHPAEVKQGKTLHRNPFSLTQMSPKAQSRNGGPGCSRKRLRSLRSNCFWLPRSAVVQRMGWGCPEEERTMVLDTVSLRFALGVVAFTLCLLFFGSFRRTRSPYSGWWCLALVFLLAGIWRTSSPGLPSRSGRVPSGLLVSAMCAEGTGVLPGQ